MSKIEKIQIKEGIQFHTIESTKFKTNLVAVFLNVPLKRENVTKEALLAAILRRGSKNLPTQQAISKTLEEMYGASFDCGIEKTGDNHTIKFYLETINDNFLPNKEQNLKEAIEILLDIVFNPLVEKEAFKESYLQEEKEHLKQIIEAKIDNKAAYAQEKCIEEMYAGKPYSLYKYGYVEDLQQITAKNLYEDYKKLLEECKIDIFVSGTLPEDLQQVIKNNENIQKLESRRLPDFNTKEEKKKIENPKVIKESMQIVQGKLVIGVDILSKQENVSYITMCYNTILGGGANSKLFQNVREKASLAYTAGSSYIKRKQTILIRAGIEMANYEQALAIIEEQLEDMKQAKFSQEDIQNAKNLILSSINDITEEQDTEITYYLGQEMANSQITIEEYKEKIKQVTKEQIVELANQVQINTIYFLKD